MPTPIFLLLQLPLDSWLGFFAPGKLRIIGSRLSPGQTSDLPCTCIQLWTRLNSNFPRGLKHQNLVWDSRTGICVKSKMSSEVPGGHPDSFSCGSATTVGLAQLVWFGEVRSLSAGKWCNFYCHCAEVLDLRPTTMFPFLRLQMFPFKCLSTKSVRWNAR